MKTPTCQSSTAQGADDKPDNEKTISASTNFIAGGLVSAISKVIVYPMETKVLLLSLGEKAVTLNDPLRMWHGVTLKAFENFYYNGLLWLLKERIRPPAPDRTQPEKRPPAGFIATWIVSFVVMLLAHPLANTVVAMQASLKNAKQPPASAWQAANAILKNQGFSGFFEGWQLSLLLKAGTAMTLVLYDLIRVRTSEMLGKDLANVVAATLGRLSEVYLFHPMKTLKARKQQGQPLLSSLSVSAILGLWRGVHTMAMADAVKIGIRFGLIERVRMLLHVLEITIIRRKKALTKIKVDEQTDISEDKRQALK